MKKIIIIVLCLFIVGCSKEMHSTNLFYMDTVINVKIYNNDTKKVNEAFNNIEEIYEKYQNMTNYYDSSSELYKFNHGEKNISNDLKELIDLGLEWNKKSNGLFNINIGGLSSIWHTFREEQTILPSIEELNRIDVSIKNNFYNSDNINVDLGALVKGYATEEAGNYLESIGLDYYIINAGGNVKVGDSYKKYYKIGITSPIDTNETFYVVKGENISVVTSGSYERYYEYNGTLYHHIIDPNTKYPANYMKSVTVIGSDSGLCDILSTTLFLMDIENGKDFIKDYDVDVIWYSNNNEIIKSDGFRYE